MLPREFFGIGKIGVLRAIPFQKVQSRISLQILRKSGFSKRENDGKSTTDRGTAFATLMTGKEGKIMRLHTYLASLFFAALLLGNPTSALAGDDYLRPMNPASSAMHEKIREFPSQGSTQQRSLAEPSETASLDSFEIASVDYCYRGSIIDPATGEMVDLFVMCTDGEIGKDFDIA